MVKNIADFGAFVDLGGIDGLLHITDMCWGRINHPSDMVKIDQEIEVKVLNIDNEKEKIALGLKQKEASPGKTSRRSTPSARVVKGEVVNIMSYGAFVKLEEGVEGLVHISEMSWTKRINHPCEVVTIGEEVDVVVLDINKDKQEISLGMKQVEENPWELRRREVPAGHGRRGQGPQHRQLRRVRRDRGRHRRPAARLRPVVDQEDRPPHRGAQEGRGHPVRRPRSRPGEAAHRPGPQADDAKTRGSKPSPATTSRA